MISITDYEDKKGNIDWKAYHKAQVEAGEICNKCGRYLLGATIGEFATGPRECGQCENLHDSTPITHDTYIRCPKCCKTFEPIKTENYHLLEDGEHDVECPLCGHQFLVKTSVSYNFKSPKLSGGSKDEQPRRRNMVSSNTSTNSRRNRISRN